MTRTSVLSWTAALLLPNLLLLMWWFRDYPPQAFLSTIYSCDLPIAFRGAAVAIVVSALSTLLMRWALVKRSRELITSAPPFALFAGKLAALWIITAVVIGFGFLHNGVVALAGVAIVFAATGIGLRVLELPPLIIAAARFDSPLERLVLATGLGFGALALMMFIGGSLGILQTWLWWLIIVALLAASFLELLKLGADLQNSSRTFLLESHPLALAAIGFVVIWVLIHVPLIWAPPLEYDVLEYHLGAPAQYLRDGRVSFLYENVYATFSQNSEMLYLLGMVLGGGKWIGMPVAHVTLFAAWILSLCAVYALASRLVNSPADLQTNSQKNAQAAASVAPALAVMLYSFVPLATQLTADFYVEHFQSFMHLTVLSAVCGFWRERTLRVRGRSSWLILAGLLAGIACGTKYTSLLYTLAPVLILVPAFCLVAGSIFEALSVAVAVGIPAFCMFFPWMLRNFAASDDPIHPLGILLKRRLGNELSQPDHLTHFEVAHRAGARNFAAMWKTFRSAFPGFSEPNPAAPYPSLLRDGECGPQLFCFALPGIFRSFRGEQLFVLLYFVLSVAFWFLFTYRLNRFLYPLLGPLAVLGALGIAQLWTLQPLRKVVGAIVLGAAIFIGPLSAVYLFYYSDLDCMGGVKTYETAALDNARLLGASSRFEAWATLNELPNQTKVLCLGDAQTFYLDRTPGYSVVFNPHPLEKILANASNTADAAEQLAAQGFTHLYINWPEWLRLDLSYAITQQNGKFEPAKIDAKQRELLWQLLSSGEIQAYGSAIPKGVQPAYLKLDARGYRLLDELLRKNTVVESTFPSAQGSPSCEIRRLINAEPARVPSLPR